MSEILERLELNETPIELFKRALVRQGAANEVKHILTSAEELALKTKNILFKKLKTLIENSFEKEALRAELLKPEIVFYEDDEEACSLLEKILDASLSIVSTNSEDVSEINIRINYLPKFLSPVLLSRFFQTNGIDISISFFTKFNDYCLVKKA